MRVLASNGVRAMIEQLQPQCERAIGHPLTVQFNSTAGLKQRIDAGEPFDVAILTSEGVDDLIKAGKITSASRAELARCGIGLGIRKGAPKPDIGTPDALKRTLQNAKSITYAQDGASRVYLEKMFNHLGIANDLKPKIVLLEGSTRATASLAGGKVELVLTLISEIIPVHGIELAGPLPPELQSYVNFGAGASPNAKNVEAAHALIQFLKGPKAAAAYRAQGMEPR